MMFALVLLVASTVSVNGHIDEVSAEGVVNLLKDWGLHKHFGMFRRLK